MELNVSDDARGPYRTETNSGARILACTAVLLLRDSLGQCRLRDDEWHNKRRRYAHVTVNRESDARGQRGVSHRKEARIAEVPAAYKSMHRLKGKTLEW